MARLSPKHNQKLEAALRANLLKRKEQARERVENPEKPLLTESAPATEKKP